MSATNRGFYLPLNTLDESGNAPVSRISDARCAKEIVDNLVSAAEKRNYVDSQVSGLVAGNPPYRPSELRKNAQSWRTNVNWRIAEAYLATALTSYWDVVSTCPTYCTVETEFGDDPQKQQKWSEIITEEFERLNREDRSLNYMFQLSQHDMVLYRTGPVLWTDTLDFRARPIPQEHVYVPDNTKSNVNDWEYCVVRVPYAVHELYNYIRNPKAAAAAGWDVEMARKALMSAAPESLWPNNHRADWMWYEQRIRNNDIYISQNSETVPVAWIFVREFPKKGDSEGKITQLAVVESDFEGFLFQSVGRFDNWRQLICPFYYDNGDGTHHSVKGLGIKAYGALEAYNRLQCHLVDAAFFGSSLHFQAQSANDLNNLSVIPMGPYIWHPPGGTYLPTVQLGTALDGPMAIKQDVLSTVTSNLSQYRQQLGQKKGNPPTAREVEYISENQTVVGRSQMNRYYEQLDDLFGERFRRAANPNLTEDSPSGPEALAFQKRCKDRGVPAKAFTKIKAVKAFRSIGFGSADQRSQSLNRLLGMLSLLDETGRRAVIEDTVSNLVGHSQSSRYVPPLEDPSGMELDQIAHAKLQVAAAKTGMPPQVAPSQNPLLYAKTFLEAASEAAGTLQQGGNPMEVYQFLEIIGPAILAHIKRMEPDPSRKEVVAFLMEQWKKLSQVHDKLGQELQKQKQQQMQQRQQQMQQQQQLMSDQALKQRQMQGDMAIKAKKQEQTMALKEAQTKQKMRLSDLTTAQKIRAKAAMEARPESEDE